MNGVEIVIDAPYDTIREAVNISEGVFAPLKGFMDARDYHSVVENMCLENGTPWTIPVTLDIPEDTAPDIIRADKVALREPGGAIVADVLIEDLYKVNYENDLVKVYGFDTLEHPGVRKESCRSAYRVGGPVTMREAVDAPFAAYYSTPHQTNAKFREKEWSTIVGFQTRNPIHRSHEYLQRIGLELADGLFIQPLVGWKKPDDFSPSAILASYERMFDAHYPPDRVFFGTLITPMRYAGPREAVFHAIIRRNFGCTHFIVGRDHAGVGGYYRKYESHELIRSLPDLGIEVLTLCGPYHCRKCGMVVTEKTCPHGGQFAFEISGVQVREYFRKGQRPPEEFMRPDISDVLISLGDDDALFND